MKSTLKVIAFPFILILSIIGAIIAKPLRLKYTEKDGLEIGIVPILILMIILYYTR